MKTLHVFCGDTGLFVDTLDEGTPRDIREYEVFNDCRYLCASPDFWKQVKSVKRDIYDKTPE